jgi:gliding motility-associated-like protein
MVANAFTPNNDGLNDCFGVPYWGRVADFSMIIYNRWGETVFKTTDPAQCWDGMYKGVRQNTGAFIYQIAATGVCGKVYRKGTVMLVR